MKYQFSGIINGKQSTDKTFKTRKKADNYLSKLLLDKNLQVNDVFAVANNKHSIEYVCDDYNRFNIRRV